MFYREQYKHSKSIFTSAVATSIHKSPWLKVTFKVVLGSVFRCAENKLTGQLIQKGQETDHEDTGCDHKTHCSLHAVAAQFNLQLWLLSWTLTGYRQTQKTLRFA